MPRFSKKLNKDEILKERNMFRKLNYNRGRRYSNSKKRKWRYDEINIILTSTDLDIDIAKQLKRSVQAIQIKRCRCKGIKIY